MESPDERVSTYMGLIADYALGPRKTDEDQRFKEDLWKVVREYQEERARVAAMEEQGA